MRAQKRDTELKTSPVKYATSWEQASLTPLGVKGRVKELLRNITLSALGTLRPPRDGKFLKALFCHYVFDDQRTALDLLIQELMALGAFVNTDTCIDMVMGKTPIDGRYFHLSFDDGFRNVATNAIPILRKYNVPAIVFVPTSFVGANGERSAQYCTEIAHYQAPIEMVRWEDLRTIVSLGFEVGSHTKTHARFSAISTNPCFLREEIAGSKRQIEAKLDVECKYIAWPYGARVDSDKSSLMMVQEAGYRACFGGFRGSVLPRRTNVYSVPRDHFEIHWPLSHIRYFLNANGVHAE